MISSRIGKAVKFSGAIGILILFSLFGFIITLLPFSSRQKRVAKTRAVQLLSKVFLFIVNVRVEGSLAHSKKQREDLKGKLIVANHVSVLDMIILSAQTPVVFVTSVEMEETPVLSFWTRSAGSLYVERRHRNRLPQDIAQIQKVLEQGFSVLLFPEGTSSNGSSVLRFKAGLFPAACNTGASVLPVCLQYESLGTEKLNELNRDRVFYYGDHRIQDHLSSLFTNPQVVASLHALSTIPSVGKTAKDLANEAQQAVQQAYRPIPASSSEVTLGLRSPETSFF